MNKWYVDEYLWQFHNIIITWNMYFFGSYIYYNNIQYKYKNYSCKINMHILNIIHFNVPNSLPKGFGFHTNLLFKNTNQ
jgi:hypothetical protein